MSYELKQLRPRHYRILELCLEGKMRKEIAQEGYANCLGGF